MSAIHKARSLLGSLVDRHLNQGVVLTIGLQFGGAIVSFAMYSLAARILSPEDFGHLAMWLCVCQMGSVIAMLGQEMFILRSLNEYAVSKQPELAKGALLFSVGIVALVPLLLAAIIGSVGVFLLGETPRLMIATGLFLIACSSISLSSHIGRSTISVLLAEGMRDFFWRSIVVGVMIALIVSSTIIEIHQFFLLCSVGVALALGIQVTAILRRLPRDVLRARPHWHFPHWIKASSGFWASSILETINQFFDVVIVYWFLDPVSAGAYFVASRVANMFAVPLGALHNISTRRIPPLYFAGKTDELNKTLKLMAEMMLLCVAVGIALLLLGADYILALFGPDFVAQKWTLITLALGTAFYAAGGPAPSVLQIAGQERRYPFIVASNIVLRFIGFAIFIPLFGLWGAALAASTSLAIVTIVLNVLCRRWLGLDPSVLFLFRKPPAALRDAASRAS
ncbi:lipopolysaccharide biosynthesis protein [Tardiphaga sp.]|uniref:lipopolysaccharide biosynthesis protein n=1 Tax=Tardiphaga sp. TaxID=1926292 RepID=UPI0037D9A51F